MDKRLRQRLGAVRKRMQTARFLSLSGLLWLLISAAGFALWWNGRLLFPAGLSPETWVLAAAAISFVIAYVLSRRSFRSDGWLAQRIEQFYPELDQRLLAAIDERPRGPNGRFGYLQESVIQQALIHDRHSSWKKIVSGGKTFSAWLVMLLGFTAVAALSIASRFESPKPLLVTAAPESIPPELTTELAVEPGDTEVERGTGFIVTARFPSDVPSDVRLIATNKDGQTQSIPMSRTLDEPLFAAHMPEVNRDFDYKVEFENGESDNYAVTVFEYPRMVRADVTLQYPEYTNQEDRKIEDTLKVTVVEGTKTGWYLELNKPVASAVLVGDNDEIALESDASGIIVATARTMTESAKWNLKLVDAEGRENKRPVQLSVKVVPNRRPDLKLVAARDVRVSPLEELNIAASVSDDYGVAQYGISYAIATADMKDIVLGTNAGAKTTTNVEHLVDFEALEAEPDQLLAYNFWAEDHGPDGTIRRTSGDMFFAEVRHFEEIFRQGQQPAGGSQQQQQGEQGQNAQQAEELAELQKQIMNATWRIIRRELSDNVTEQFDEDVKLLVDSQQAALEQLLELSQEIQDSESVDFTIQVQTDMLESSKQLQSGRAGKTAGPLNNALTHQRLAYQGLLRLRAREHEVVQSQQQSSSSSSSSSQTRQQFQQQLEQLQLQNDQNRYETQRQAEQQEDDAQREVRQVLNRLQELARRQEDINKQLKDIEAALQAVEDEEERQRLENQLKRLRDQQEQMLRDIDELQNRMQEAQNQEAMQPAQQQVEQSRENVQQASEAMQAGDASRALTAGTRAERELEDVRDRLREETANQFEDAVRQMRNTAQGLDQRQEQITQQLAEQSEQASDEPPRLRSQQPAEGSDTTEELTAQQKELEQLLRDMQQTVTEAESSEPLLAQKLYDAIRDTYRRRVPEDLETTEQLVNRGLRSQAQQLSESVSEGIQRLRDDVEQAAESVLGDETEGLRRALTELDRIADQLDNEIQRNDRNADPSASNAATEQEPTRDSQNGDSQQQSSSEPDADAPSNPSQQSGNAQQESDNEQQQNGSRPRQSQSNQDSQSETADPQNQQESAQGQQQGQQPGQQQGQQPGSQQGQQQGPGGRQQGQQQNGEPSQQTGQPSQRSGRRSLRDIGSIQQSGQGAEGGGALQQFAEDARETSPITGSDFRDWSDRLRDVEEMIEDPELRAEAAGIRDRARGFRQDFTRHSKEPEWDLVRELVAVPIQELRQKVNEALLRRSAEKNEVVPIDRDPVPKQFSRQVENYYEELGIGQ